MPAISESVPDTADDGWEIVPATAWASSTGLIFAGINDSVEWNLGVRFTTIGPSAGNTIDDANLRYGIYQETLDASPTDDIDVFVDIGSSAQWVGVSDVPSGITRSTAKGTILGTVTPGDDREVDITAALQEWVDDGDYNGDIRFAWVPTAGVGPWDNMSVQDTNATWSSGLPVPMVLEGNYTVGGVAVRRNLIFY